MPAGCFSLSVTGSKTHLQNVMIENKKFLTFVWWPRELKTLHFQNVDIFLLHYYFVYLNCILNCRALSSLDCCRFTDWSLSWTGLNPFSQVKVFWQGGLWILCKFWQRDAKPSQDVCFFIRKSDIILEYFSWLWDHKQGNKFSSNCCNSSMFYDDSYSKGFIHVTWR